MTDQVRQDQRILNDLGLLLGGIQPQEQSSEEAFRALQRGQNPAPPPAISPEILQLLGGAGGQQAPAIDPRAAFQALQQGQNVAPAADPGAIQKALGSLFGGR